MVAKQSNRLYLRWNGGVSLDVRRDKAEMCLDRTPTVTALKMIIITPLGRQFFRQYSRFANFLLDSDIYKLSTVKLLQTLLLEKHLRI